MLSIWFMFDNHTFAKVEGDREAIVQRASDLFRQDGCGSLFVRDECDATVRTLDLHGHVLANGKYGILRGELEEWADKITAERSFRTLMV